MSLAALPATRTTAGPTPRAVFWLAVPVGQGPSSESGNAARRRDRRASKGRGPPTCALELPAQRRVCAREDRPSRARSRQRARQGRADEDRKERSARSRARPGASFRTEIHRREPCGRAATRPRRQKNADSTSGAARPDHARELRRGRPAAKRRESRHASRSPGQPKTPKAKPRGGQHALRPAAVSRGLVQQGSRADCAAPNPPGYAAGSFRFFS